MTPEIIFNPGSDTCAQSEENIIYWEENIADKRYKIQVML